MVTPWFGSSAAASVLPSGLTAIGAWAPSIWPTLAPEAMSTIAVPSAPATRICLRVGEEGHVALTVRRRERVLNDRFTALGHVPHVARSAAARPAPVRSLSVTAATYLPSGLNDRRVSAPSNADNGAPTTSNVAEVHELQLADCLARRTSRRAGRRG